MRPWLSPSIVDYEIRSGLAHLDWLTCEIEFRRSCGEVADVLTLMEEATEVARHVYSLLTLHVFPTSSAL